MAKAQAMRTTTLAGAVVALALTTPATAQPTLSLTVSRGTRVTGTTLTLPPTADGISAGVSTPLRGRLGVWASFGTWSNGIGKTLIFGTRINLARAGWKLRPSVSVGTWRKPNRGAPWELLYGGGASFAIRGQWSGSVSFVVIRVDGPGVTYVAPQAGIAYSFR